MSGVRSVHESRATRKRTPCSGQASRYARRVRSIRSSSLCAGMTMSRRTQTSLVWVGFCGWAVLPGAERGSCAGDYKFNTRTPKRCVPVTPVTVPSTPAGGGLGHDGADDLAEVDRRSGAPAQHDRVAVLQERAPELDQAA